jgi:hypothetical protein
MIVMDLVPQINPMQCPHCSSTNLKVQQQLLYTVTTDLQEYKKYPRKVLVRRNWIGSQSYMGEVVSDKEELKKVPSKEGNTQAITFLCLDCHKKPMLCFISGQGSVHLQWHQDV